LADTLLVLILAAVVTAWLHQDYRPIPEAPSVSGHCAVPVFAARLAGGTLPPGMTLGHAGLPEGTPDSPGSYRYQVAYSDGCRQWKEWHEIRVEPLPILTVEAHHVRFTAVAGAPPFVDGLVTVSGSPAGRTFRAEVLNASWLTVLPRDGRIPATGQAFDADVLRFRIDPKGLAPGLHSARVQLSAWRGVNAPEFAVYLEVRPVQSLLPFQPKPIEVAPPPITAPSPSVIVSPQARIPSQAIPTPALTPRSTPGRQGRHSGAGPTQTLPARSRVLPFPKVNIDKPLKTPAAEPPPARTKPSPMPTAPAEKH
jgi:hypothetical protein